jgi:hypothetical protein
MCGDGLVLLEIFVAMNIDAKERIYRGRLKEINPYF